MDRVARIAFVLGLLVLAFGYGFVARGWKLPPYGQLKPVGDAAQAATRYFTDADYMSFRLAYPKGGASPFDTAAAAPGLTLIPRYDGQRFVAELIGLDGRVVHSWHTSFREVWGENPGHVQFAADDSVIAWHGTHLYPDGSLLLNFEGQLFPFGGGLVKLDKDSQVVWKLARNTHHVIAVAEDGTIWVPSLNYRPNGMPEFPGLEPWFYEDTILKSRRTARCWTRSRCCWRCGRCPACLPEGRHVRSDASQRHRTGHAGTGGAFPMLKAGDLVVSCAMSVRSPPSTRNPQGALGDGRAVPPPARPRPAAKRPRHAVRQSRRRPGLRPDPHPGAGPGHPGGGLEL